MKNRRRLVSRPARRTVSHGNEALVRPSAGVLTPGGSAPADAGAASPPRSADLLVDIIEARIHAIQDRFNQVSLDRVVRALVGGGHRSLTRRAAAIRREEAELWQDVRQSTVRRSSEGREYSRRLNALEASALVVIKEQLVSRLLRVVPSLPREALVDLIKEGWPPSSGPTAQQRGLFDPVKVRRAHEARLRETKGNCKTACHWLADRLATDVATIKRHLARAQNS